MIGPLDDLPHGLSMEKVKIIPVSGVALKFKQNRMFAIYGPTQKEERWTEPGPKQVRLYIHEEYRDNENRKINGLN